MTSRRAGRGFSALQRAENSSMQPHHIAKRQPVIVSVLFSEPKIPQSSGSRCAASPSASFSALQRAENSSIYGASGVVVRRLPRFQCSSASRKFLNLSVVRAGSRLEVRGFSALQRAENSSITGRSPQNLRHRRFQCSSASRKFLNSQSIGASLSAQRRFSALQRAENSSILPRFFGLYVHDGRFSALQRAENSSILPETSKRRTSEAVSVLFSEPKIPQ